MVFLSGIVGSAAERARAIEKTYVMEVGATGLEVAPRAREGELLGDRYQGKEVGFMK